MSARNPEEIFEEARNLPPTERGSFLTRTCGEDHDLRERLIAMLAVAEQSSLTVGLPPDRIGRYEILKELGQGGMGVVYKARDRKLSRHVAIKVLPRHLAGDEEYRRRFGLEAKLLAAISHPNIATLHDIERDGDTQFLTIEYVSGESLAERLEDDGQLPLDVSLTLCRDVAEALEAAHEKGIIHRDLKPANVMIKPNGIVKVLDFGVGKTLRQSSSEESTSRAASSGSSMLLGTPGYMSPEQYDCGTVDHRTDIWAFGCLLYECLTGKQVVTIESGAGRRSSREDFKIKNLDALPPQTPDRIRELISKCLQIDPRERPLSMARVHREIQSQIASEALRAESKGKALRWVLASLGAVIMGTAALVIGIRNAGQQLAYVELVDAKTIRAVDTAGESLWSKPLGDAVAKNTAGPIVNEKAPYHPFLIVGDGGEQKAVAVATGSSTTRGKLWLLEPAEGNTLWTRGVRWENPVNPDEILNPHFYWQATTQWDKERILVVGIRNNVWYPSAVQFMTLDGDILETYYHPGFLFLQGQADLDGDGRTSLILYGDNSSARFLKDIVPFNTEMHCGCVVLLQPPVMSGQAYPYSELGGMQRDWPGMARAREEAYLVIPPLDKNTEAIVTVVRSSPLKAGSATLEVRIVDGRVLTVGSDLYPRRCWVPPDSRAEEVLTELQIDSLKLLHIKRGQLDYVVIPVD